MNKNFQNTLIFLLLVAGMITFLVKAWTSDPSEKDPKVPDVELDSWFENSQVDSGELIEKEDPVDIEAIREALREELLVELRKEMQAEPTPIAEPTSAPAPTATPRPVVQINPTPVPKNLEEVEGEPTPVPVDLVAMQTAVDDLDARIEAMKRILRNEDRALDLEKNRILKWKRDLQTKYEDELFTVTKTRAEQRQIQAAISAWRSRSRRQQYRSEILEDAEADLDWRQERLREEQRKQR